MHFKIILNIYTEGPSNTHWKRVVSGFWCGSCFLYSFELLTEISNAKHTLCTLPYTLSLWHTPLRCERQTTNSNVVCLQHLDCFVYGADVMRCDAIEFEKNHFKSNEIITATPYKSTAFFHRVFRIVNIECRWYIAHPFQSSHHIRFYNHPYTWMFREYISSKIASSFQSKRFCIQCFPFNYQTLSANFFMMANNRLSLIYSTLFSLYRFHTMPQCDNICPLYSNWNMCAETIFGKIFFVPHQQLPH